VTTDDEEVNGKKKGRTRCTAIRCGSRKKTHQKGDYKVLKQSNRHSIPLFDGCDWGHAARQAIFKIRSAGKLEESPEELGDLPVGGTAAAERACYRGRHSGSGA